MFPEPDYMIALFSEMPRDGRIMFSVPQDLRLPELAIYVGEMTTFPHPCQ